MIERFVILMSGLVLTGLLFGIVTLFINDKILKRRKRKKMTNKELITKLDELEQDAHIAMEDQDYGSMEYGENQGVLDTIYLVQRWLRKPLQ